MAAEVVRCWARIVQHLLLFLFEVGVPKPPTEIQIQHVPRKRERFPKRCFLLFSRPIVGFPFHPTSHLDKIWSGGGFFPTGRRDSHHGVKPDPRGQPVQTFHPGSKKRKENGATEEGRIWSAQGMFLYYFNSPLRAFSWADWFPDRDSIICYPDPEGCRKAKLENRNSFYICRDDCQLCVIRACSRSPVTSWVNKVVVTNLSWSTI